VALATTVAPANSAPKPSAPATSAALASASAQVTPHSVEIPGDNEIECEAMSGNETDYEDCLDSPSHSDTKFVDFGTD
jgi:hypothetical protein